MILDPTNDETVATTTTTTTITGARERGERIAPWVAAIFVALPTLIARFPPMTDLPMHAATVAMLRHFGDPAWFPPGLYELNIGHPNQLFHLVGAALSYVVDVEFACKLLIAAAQAGMILAAARLADHLGTTRWTSLLVAPLALGWTFYWGLVANLLGFGLFLLALPTFDRATDKPTARGALASLGWMALLYFAHESVMVIACSAVLVFTLGRSPGDSGLPGWKATLLRIAPIVFAAALFVGQQLVQKRLFDPEDAHLETSVVYGSFWRKVQSIPETIVGSTDRWTRLGMLAIVVTSIAAFALARLRERKDTPADPDGTRTFASRVHAYRYELVALVNFVAYLTMPFGFAGGSLFNHRFFHPAFAVLVVTLAPHVARRSLKLFPKLLAAAVPIAFVLVALPQFEDSDRCYRELDKLLPLVADRSAIAYVEADPGSGSRTYEAATEASSALIHHGGRLIFSLGYSVIAPVRLAARARWSEATRRHLRGTLLFMPEHDLHMFRYVLVHTRDPNGLALMPMAMPEARFVDSVGEWSLFESRLPLIALTDPEPPIPSPHPSTLRARLRQIVLSLNAERAKAIDEGRGPLLDKGPVDTTDVYAPAAPREHP